MSSEVVAKYRLLFKDLASAGLLKVATNAAKMQGALKSAVKGIAGLGVVAGGAMAVLANSHMQMAHEISNFSQVANTNVADFQKMAAGAKVYGIESDKLADQLKDMNDRVGDFAATGGGPMADFFDNIGPKVGVTADMFKGLSGADALQLYYDSLEKAGLSQAEMTFYMEAMISDGTNLIPMLKNGGAELDRLGSAAEKAGAILSELDIANAAELKGNLAVLGLQFDGFKNSIMRAAMPALISISAWFADNQDTVKAFSDKVVELATIIGGELVAGFEYVKPTLFAIGDWFVENQDTIKGFASKAKELAGIVAGKLADGFEIVVPLVTKFSEMLLEVINFISDNSTVFEAMALGISAGALAFSAITIAVGVWTGIAGLATAVTTAFGVAVAFLTSPILLIAAAIAIVVGIGYLLYKNWDTISAKAKEIWGGIADYFSGITEQIKTTVTGAWDNIKNSISLKGTEIKSSITNVFNALPGPVQDALILMGTVISTNFEIIKTIFTTAWEVIKAIFTGNWTAIPAIVGTGVTAIWAIISTKFTAIQTFLTTIWQSIKTAIVNKWIEIKTSSVTYITSMVTSIINKFTQLKTSVIQKIIGLKESIISTLSGLAGKMLAIGGDVVQGLVNGITGKLKSAISAARDLASGVSKAVKNFFVVKSPSRLFAEIGEFLSLGLAGGISAKAGAAIAQAKRLASGVAGAASGIGSTLMSDLGRDATIAAEAKSDLMMTHRFEFDISGKIAGAQAQVNTTYKSNGNNAGSNMPVML